MSYDNTNRGALFKNTDKQIGDNKPDYRGTIVIGPEHAGKEINIAAWLKESGPQSRNPGMKYMSLAVSVIHRKAPETAPTGQNDQPFDDTIPF